MKVTLKGNSKESRRQQNTKIKSSEEEDTSTGKKGGKLHEVRISKEKFF